MRQGMSSHQSARSGKDEWLTPPELLSALGDFDLDPCSPIDRPWDTAKQHYTIYDNGLLKEWNGRVWLNPPYGQQTGRWLRKLQLHGNGIALIFARTETEMFFDYVWSADAVLFIKGRLYFHHNSGKKASANAGAPSVLVAYGIDNVSALDKISNMGKLLKL